MSAAGCLVGSAALLVSVVLWNDVQTSRAQTTYQACQETNMRHDRTIEQYDRQIDVAKRLGILRGERLARAEESRKFTVGLIEQLAPRVDCRALVRRRLGADALQDLK